MKIIILFVYIVTQQLTNAEIDKQDIEVSIDNEVTSKLTKDLMKSLEHRYHLELEKTIGKVLNKVKSLLENGTRHVYTNMKIIEQHMNDMKSANKQKVDVCLRNKQNEAKSMAEKALHQMVLCGYALIGQDPSQALRKITEMKNNIENGLNVVRHNKDEIFVLVKECSQEHTTLKDLLRCVTSKSPLLKSTMTSLTASMVTDAIQVTNMVAHGAMHEACLIEVLRGVMSNAQHAVDQVQECAFAGEAVPQSANPQTNNDEDKVHSGDDNQI